MYQNKQWECKSSGEKREVTSLENYFVKTALTMSERRKVWKIFLHVTKAGEIDCIWDKIY